MFRFGALHAAMEATLDAQPAVTDEAAALERAGLHPRLVLGSETNLKVTRAEDFDLAALLLQRSASTCA